MNFVAQSYMRFALTYRLACLACYFIKKLRLEVIYDSSLKIILVACTYYVAFNSRNITGPKIPAVNADFVIYLRLSFLASTQSFVI